MAPTVATGVLHALISAAYVTLQLSSEKMPGWVTVSFLIFVMPRGDMDKVHMAVQHFCNLDTLVQVIALRRYLRAADSYLDGEAHSRLFLMASIIARVAASGFQDCLPICPFGDLPLRT